MSFRRPGPCLCLAVQGEGSCSRSFFRLQKKKSRKKKRARIPNTRSSQTSEKPPAELTPEVTGSALPKRAEGEGLAPPSVPGVTAGVADG
jgi:hypothetical protein